MASSVTGPQQLRAGALKALVLVNIGSDGAAAVRWRQRTTLPTVELLDPLRVVFIRQQLPPAYVDRVFRSESGLMALEQCKGAWRPVLDSLVSSAPEDESLASLAAAFRAEVEPLSRVRDTRRKHETAWNAVVTWAVARDGADQLLPMTADTLYALLWDALSVGGSLSVLKGLVNAVQARHKFFELTPPVSSRAAILGSQRLCLAFRALSVGTFSQSIGTWWFACCYTSRLITPVGLAPARPGSAASAGKVWLHGVTHFAVWATR